MLISLKDALLFDKSSLSALLALLQELSQKLKVDIGFCDYNEFKHHIILQTYGVLVNFCLFETRQIAELFYGRVSRSGLNSVVLLFNNNIAKREYIARILQERGYRCEICKNSREFVKMRAQYRFSIGSWTTLYSLARPIEVYNRDDMVVYRIKGLIDSSFGDIFENEAFEASLANGFKFFAFIVDASSVTNTLGASFLSQLAKKAQLWGASVGICGIHQSSISPHIFGLLAKAGIGLFSSLDDFVTHNEQLYGSGKAHKSKQEGLNKELIKHLPAISQRVINLCQALANEPIKRSKIELKISQITDANICGALAFYGDISFRFMLSLPSQIVRKICHTLGDETQMEDKFYEFMQLICTQIMELFIENDIFINASFAKIFVLQSGIDEGSLGACLELEIGKDKGLLFISKL